MDYTKIKTDADLMELMAHGSDAYPFRFYEENMSMFDFRTIDWHWHAEFEFVLVEDGEVMISVGTDTFRLTAGQGLFINSKELHYFHSDGPAAIPNFLFSAAFLAPPESLLYQKYIEPVAASGPARMIFREEDSSQAKILACFRRLIAIQRAEETDELETHIEVCRLWKLLSEAIAGSAGQRTSGHSAVSRARLQLMLQFIQDSYASDLTLEAIAAHGSVSKSTALKLFHEYLHTSPVDYLVSYRLSRAASLLARTEKKVHTVSAEVGFANVDYFCRTFKKRFSLTPTEYRRQMTVQDE